MHILWESHLIKKRSLKILKLAIPAILAIIITFGYVLVNIAAAGTLNEPRVLAGIGISNVLINGLWFTTFNGFSGALQTLVSQTASRKQYKESNQILQAAIIVLILLYIPLGIILYNIESIMGGQSDSITIQYAVTYTRTVMVGFFFEALYDLEKKYLL